MLDCDRTGHAGPVTDNPELHPDSSADTGRLSGPKRPASFPGNQSGRRATSAKLWNRTSSAREASTRQTIAWIALIEHCAEPIDFRPSKGPEVKFCY